jgi:hypothetical protein
MWSLGVVLESSPKKAARGNKPGKGGNRFWKNIGLGFKTPREAIEGLYSFIVQSFSWCFYLLVSSYKP